MTLRQDLTHDSKGQPAFTLEGSDPPSLWRALTELQGPCRLFFLRAPTKNKMRKLKKKA